MSKRLAWINLLIKMCLPESNVIITYFSFLSNFMFTYFRYKGIIFVSAMSEQGMTGLLSPYDIWEGRAGSTVFTGPKTIFTSLLHFSLPQYVIISPHALFLPLFMPLLHFFNLFTLMFSLSFLFLSNFPPFLVLPKWYGPISHFLHTPEVRLFFIYITCTFTPIYLKVTCVRLPFPRDQPTLCCSRWQLT